MNEELFGRIWRQVASKLGWFAVGFAAAIVLFAIVFHLWDGHPEWLEASVMAVLSSAFAACLVGLVFQYGELEKRIGVEAVDTVLSTLFDPERKLYGYPNKSDLLKLGSTAVALANNVLEEDDRRGLVAAHMNELSAKLARPQRSLDVRRVMTFNPKYPSAMHVSETMTATYSNKGEEAFENLLVWRSVRSLDFRDDGTLIPPDASVMSVTASMPDGQGSFVGDHENPHFEKYTVQCEKVNGSRLWVNPRSTAFIVKGKTEDFKVSLSREFWLSIEDTCVTYTWPEPISGLTLTVDCQGFQANFEAKLVDCYKCDKGSSDASCCVCDQDVFYSHFGLDGGTAGVKSWTGSQSKFALEWEITSGGVVDVEKPLENEES